MNQPLRLLDRLQSQIAEEADPIQADCLRAELGVYLARQGQFDQADAQVRAVRLRHEQSPLAATSVWLAIYDALRAYFSSLELSAARHKLLRAYAMSNAARFVELNALCAAWLAQLEFSEYRAESMAAMAVYLQQAFNQSSPDNHRVRVRACLTVATAYQACGAIDTARRWFDKTRAHALADGDQGMISALMHNMAALRLDNLRQQIFANREQIDVSALSLTDKFSVENYDHLVGVASLGSWVPILRARGLVMLNEPQRAMQIYEQQLDTLDREGLLRRKGPLLADMAWCHARLERPEMAQAIAQQAEQSLISGAHHLDDVAATHSRLELTYALLGNQESELMHQRRAQQVWTEYAAFQARVVELLEPLQVFKD